MSNPPTMGIETSSSSRGRTSARTRMVDTADDGASDMKMTPATGLAYVSAGCGQRVEGDVVAELSQLVQGALFGLVGVASGVVVPAEVGVGDVGGEHVPDRGEQGVFDGDEGFHRAAAGGDASVAGGESGVLFASGDAECGDAEGAFEVG